MIALTHETLKAHMHLFSANMGYAPNDVRLDAAWHMIVDFLPANRLLTVYEGEYFKSIALDNEETEIPW